MARDGDAGDRRLFQRPEPQGDVARLMRPAWIMRATNATPHRGRAAPIPAFATAKERAMPQPRSLTRRHLISHLSAAGFCGTGDRLDRRQRCLGAGRGDPGCRRPGESVHHNPAERRPSRLPGCDRHRPTLDSPGRIQLRHPPDLVEGMVVPNNAFFIRSHGPSGHSMTRRSTPSRSSVTSTLR